tara:strand:- start:14 stop:211 length:198 start_codon:yes stop_codon:yes gene_type:complete
MNDTMLYAISPFRPLTYTEHYYIELGYMHEQGKADDHEYKAAMAEGPQARRLLNRGAMEALQRRY